MNYLKLVLVINRLSTSLSEPTQIPKLPTSKFILRHIQKSKNQRDFLFIKTTISLNFFCEIYHNHRLRPQLPAPNLSTTVFVFVPAHHLPPFLFLFTICYRFRFCPQPSSLFLSTTVFSISIHRRLRSRHCSPPSLFL